MMQHGNYDAYWKARNVRQHLKDVKPAVLTVGGWFDAENLFGALECYQAIEASTPGAKNTIVMGPWYHGQWGGDPGEKMGNATFDAKTGDFYRESIIFPFFEHHLQAKADPKLPEAMVFQTGTNQWKRHDAWPPKSVKPTTLFFQADGKLAMEPLPPRAGRVRRVRQRPGPPRPLHRERQHRDDPRVHDRRPAVRRASARRPGLPDRTPRRRPHPRRADHARPQGVDLGHRLRLGRQGDRRLPERLPRRGQRQRAHVRPGTERVPQGRVSATRARRDDPRQVPR